MTPKPILKGELGVVPLENATGWSAKQMDCDGIAFVLTPKERQNAGIFVSSKQLRQLLKDIAAKRKNKKK